MAPPPQGRGFVTPICGSNCSPCENNSLGEIGIEGSRSHCFRLFSLHPASGGPVTNANFADLCKAVERVGANRAGKWMASCAVHRPILKEKEGYGAPSSPQGGPARELAAITFSEAPGRHWMVVPQKKLLVEGGDKLPEIMEKIQLYRHRISLNFDGFLYTMGDFQFRVGRALLPASESLKGILVEIEYALSSSVEKTGKVCEEMTTFMQDLVATSSVNGRFECMDSKYAEFELGDTYTWDHTTLQYVALATFFLAARH